QLEPNEARERCSPSQLRGDSCSDQCGRRVPRGEDNGVVRVEQASSFVSAQLCKFAIANPCCSDQTPALPSTLPGLSPVFLPCEFSRALENFFLGLELTAMS